MTVMLRVSEGTRDRVMRVAAEDFRGSTVEEALNRLLDEHWEAKAVAAMDRFRAEDPDGWAEYLAASEDWEGSAAPATDAWDEQAPA